MTTTELIELTGGLSEPSKMPCYGYSLPAKECDVGSKLRTVPNSTCSGCYAYRGNYAWAAVQAALYRRLDRVQNNPLWHEHIAELIERKEKSGYFRWHDSGDIQSVSHLEQIIWVADQLKRIKFWLPTREYERVSSALKHKKCPPNLRIRLSAHIIDGPLPQALATRLGVGVSGVSREDSKVTCPAPAQGNQCLDCRRCWGSKPVVYKKH